MTVINLIASGALVFGAGALVWLRRRKKGEMQDD